MAPKHPPEEPGRSSREYTNISFVFKYRGVPQYLSADEAVSLHSELSQFVEDLRAVEELRAVKEGYTMENLEAIQNGRK